MTYRFVLESVHPGMVHVKDLLLDCTWVLSLQMWFCVNSTVIGAENNAEITEALYSNAVNCIVRG